MGKEGDLWDDSALINAFDHAISTYKKMHRSGKYKDDTPQEVETVVGENGANVEFGTVDTARDVEEKGNNPAADASDLGETGNVSKLGENHCAESLVDQPSLDSTNGQDIQSAQNSDAYAQAVDDYPQLLAQYYELEEKRVKILEQINQYGGWNYQNVAGASSSGVPYSNSQDYSMSTYQVSDPNAVCACCPCFSQCSSVPCTSVPFNNLSAEMDHKMSISCEDDKIHKMAMGAAERALSTIRTTIAGDFNVNEGKERNNFEHTEINGSETDLAAVLNAWYSAGFHTGKYVAEQSIQNSRQK